jgi:NDP-sugar pyrophosphorylase family protein
MQCLILAGGLGTRLYPITREIPKALVPVRGKPFCHYQLSWLARQGIDRVVYCIGHRGRQIIDVVGDGSAWGIRVDYVDEGKTLLGTGGAIRLAIDSQELADDFFVTYGDSFLPIDFSPVFEAHVAADKPALMTVLRNDDRWDRSNVIFEAPDVVLYDKRCDDATRARMAHIDYGLLVLSRRLVSAAVPPATVIDLADVLGGLSRSGQLAGYEVRQRFYEVGSHDGLADFERYVETAGL